MLNLWGFFMAHWLAVFWAVILTAFLIIGVIRAVDEIRLKIERRRYQENKG